MATYTSNAEYVDAEKGYDEKHAGGVATTSDEYAVHSEEPRELKRHLQGRHMQMIAIGMSTIARSRVFLTNPGGAIGAGFFVGSGSALNTGGPAPLVICFIIIGFMLLFTMQALCELTVLYPVNGAFYTYAVRFVDPAWGFACGWVSLMLSNAVSSN